MRSRKKLRRRRAQLAAPLRRKPAVLKGRRYEGNGKRQRCRAEGPGATFGSSSERQITAFLIDIWRLEIAVSFGKQTKAMQSNRHAHEALPGPRFSGFS